MLHFANGHEQLLAAAAEAVPPVSTALKCVINLSVQFFILYTAQALIRTYNNLTTGTKADKASQVVAMACRTLNYAPMLCVLFVGTRMRALELSQGEPDKYGLPQDFVKTAMQACAWSILAQAVMVLAAPAAGVEVTVSKDGTMEVSQGGVVAKVLTFVRYVALLATYGGFAVVCYGAVAMEAPAALGATKPVAPALAATMNLCYQYFGIYLVLQIIETFHQFGYKSQHSQNLLGALKLCEITVAFAPMLCILFIGARMRALQIGTEPQQWAKDCFFYCAYAILAQLILIVVTVLFLGGDVKKGSTDSDVTFTHKSTAVNAGLTIIRYAAMLLVYGGFSAVIYSLITIEHPEGAAKTPAVSPDMLCVTNLTLQYFFVYLVLWILITTKEFAGSSDFLNVAIATFDSAKATVMYCPMLAVLFIGLRLRALQITAQKGAPQGFAQQAMFFSTYAVMFQLLMVLILPVFTRSAPDMDDSGNPKPAAGGNRYLAMAVETFKYISLIALYGGAATIVYALFTITPSTANGQGSLIPGVQVPAPSTPGAF